MKNSSEITLIDLSLLTRPPNRNIDIHHFEALLEQSLTKLILKSKEYVPANLRGTPDECILIMSSVSDFIKELSQKLYTLPHLKTHLTKEVIDKSSEKIFNKLLYKFF